MSSEVLFFSGAAVVLLAGGVLLGRMLANRRRVELLPLMGALVASVIVLTVMTGPLGARSLAMALAALLWGAVLLATVMLVRRSRPRLAIVVGVVGGVIAIHAAVITFVVARFSATEAPREYALLWLPAAMTGAVKNLGEPGSGVETPLWVRMSQDAGLLPLLVVLLSGFALSYVVRMGVLARPPAST
ncbi:hypothetical protein GA0070607_2124 [Micromonospora coriariae]|uniref:Uncharacterized protein n=1 Tax=Micromonospora coriariae TaxID=285665 RepID=A0A1C4VHN2_9ACTN|nr:hypothetical protein [Micromonospora coriariae]SCE83315.1 hypothetical protein GA0070607_2124 [Micromonospora coriariae]